MATVASSLLGEKHYNGGWSTWTVRDVNNRGYAAGNKCMVYKIQTGTFTGTQANVVSKLSGHIYLRRTSGTSGTIYLRIFDYDPTTGSGEPDYTKAFINHSFNWSRSKSEWHYVDYSINTSSLKSNTTYYLAFTCGGATLELNHVGTLTADVTYTPINSHPTNPSLYIEDLGTNKVRFYGKLPTTTDNPVTKSVFYYVLKDEWPNSDDDDTRSIDLGTTSGGNYSYTFDIPAKVSKVWGVTYCYFKYGSTPTNSGHQGKEVKYYSTPGAPGRPILNNTLTLNENGKKLAKRNWHFYWRAARPGNCSSNVAISGYRIRVFRKAVGETNWHTVEIKDSSGTSYGNWTDEAQTDWVYDKTSAEFADADNPTFVFNPEQSRFNTGDSLKIGIYSWVDFPSGGRFYNGSGYAIAQVDSDEYLIDPAGVMRIKTGENTNGTPIFSEGRVFIKTGGGDTAADWTEAKTVKIKTGTNSNGDIWSDSK